MVTGILDYSAIVTFVIAREIRGHAHTLGGTFKLSVLLLLDISVKILHEKIITESLIVLQLACRRHS